MSDTEEYGIQSIPPRYDQYNSFYIHTSEGYEKAVEDIDAEKRDVAEAEMRTEEQLRLDSEELKRLEEADRENEKRILEEIHQKEIQVEFKNADVSEYDEGNDIPPGSNVDLLA